MKPVVGPEVVAAPIEGVSALTEKDAGLARDLALSFGALRPSWSHRVYRSPLHDGVGRWDFLVGPLAFGVEQDGAHNWALLTYCVSCVSFESILRAPELLARRGCHLGLDPYPGAHPLLHFSLRDKRGLVNGGTHSRLFSGALDSWRGAVEAELDRAGVAVLEAHLASDYVTDMLLTVLSTFAVPDYLRLPR